MKTELVWKPFHRTLPLYLGFWATGVGVALPGALLPALAARWHLNDAQSGRLFLMSWLGSSLGALLVRGSLRRVLWWGSVATAAGLFGLSATGGLGVYALMLLYGGGLGATMTSISLLRHQQTQGSGTEMVRLNLIWAIGAVLAPIVAAPVLAGHDFSWVFRGLSLGFVGLALWIRVQPEIRLRREQTRGNLRAWFSTGRIPLGLLAMIFLITGVEASAGGWLTTYAHRGGQGLGQEVAAPSLFWAGLLLSRLFWSVREGWLGEARVVRASVALMAAAGVLLVASTAGAALLTAAFLMGFGIGPTYPLLLGWALRVRRGAPVFFIAGVGSAWLPWMTGLVSTARGSLRTGIAVPMAGALMMLAIALLAPVGRWSTEPDHQGEAEFTA